MANTTTSILPKWPSNWLPVLRIQDAMTKCRPILLEPIMNLSVRVPDEYTGTIIGDLNKRRGAILGMDPEGDEQVISAQVPMMELSKYAIDLRSMTQGLGSYTVSMDRYDPVPENIASRIIAEAARD